MELLRVFNKKRLCIFGLMIILNAVLFIMGNKINEQEIIYRELVNSYNDNISITEMSKNYLQENPQVSDEDFKEARKIFLERLDYVKNYKERTQNSIDKIKAVQKSSLFSQKNSRSYLELIKSKNDLTKDECGRSSENCARTKTCLAFPIIAVSIARSAFSTIVQQHFQQLVKFDVLILNARCRRNLAYLRLSLYRLGNVA